MEYVGVVGHNNNRAANVIKKYFDNYLISIAECTTSKNWSMFTVNKYTKSILDSHKKHHKNDLKLYLDSGGFQIITNYIKKKRINEYIDVYHYVLNKYSDEIDYIFSLDINNTLMTKEEILDFNITSTRKSIELCKKKPEILDKQLFVIQTRNKHIFDIWQTIMEDQNVYNTYNKFSFGGLVGLKKETNAKFSHIVPFVLWLIQKVKQHNGNITHIHLLGQSSKLIILTTTLLEKLIKDKFEIDIKFTMDSSEIVRFSPIDQKFPLLFNENEDFYYVKNLNHLTEKIHTQINFNNIEIDFNKDEVSIGKLDSSIIIELVSININNTIKLSKKIIDEHYKDILSYDYDKIKNMHVFMHQGRFVQEFLNNLNIINECLDLMDKNIDLTDYCNTIIDKY